MGGYRGVLHMTSDPPLSKVHELATAVYQIRGHIKGRTLLPFPQVAIVVIIIIIDHYYQYVDTKKIGFWRNC